MANRYWVGGTGTWTTTTTNWSASSGGASGASAPTAADSVFFDQAATYTVTMTGALTCLDITVSAGTVTFTSTGTLAVSGSMSLLAGTLWSATGTITFNATTSKTITTNAVTINSPITFAGVGGTWTLGSNLTLGLTLTTTLTNGTISLSTFTLATGIFSSAGTAARSISFGTGNIDLTHTTAGTIVLAMATATLFTVSGTGGFTSAMSVTRTFQFGSTAGGSATNSPNLSLTSGASIPTLSAASWFNTLNFNGSTCTPASTTLNLNGLTLALGGTYTNLTPTMVGTGTITSNGNTTLTNLTINSTSGTTTLGADFALTATSTTTLTSGTLALGTFTLSTGIFSSNNSTTRSISFGTGTINLTHTTATTTVLNMPTVTGFTYTGTGGFTTAATVARAVFFGNTAGGTSANAPNMTVTGTGTSVISFATGSWFNTLSFTSTVFNPGTTALNLNGLTLSPSGTFTSLTPTMVGTGTITSSGNTTLASLTIASTSGTTTLGDTFTLTATSTTTLTSGTLALANFTLSTGIFSSAGLLTRAISFGTGNIALTHTTAGTTVLSMATVTGFTYTATTGGFTSAMSVARTFTFGTTAGSTTNAPNLSLPSGASIPTLTTGSWFNTLNFNGSTCTPAVTALNLNGLTLASGGNYASLTPTMVGTGTITSNTNTTLASLNIASTSGTTTLGDTFTLTATSTTTLTSGTLALGTFTLSTGIFSSSSAVTRAISFGTGNIALTHTTAATVVLNMATVTGFTYTGTGGFTSAMGNTRTFTFGTTGGSTTNSVNLTLSGASVATLTTASYFNKLDFTTSTFNPGTTTLNLNGLTLSNGVGAVYTTMTVNMVGTGTITPNTNTTLGPLIINNGAGTTTLAAALSCTTFTMTAGTINFATFNLTCSSTAAYTSGTLSNIGTITCTTFTVNGTFTLSSGTITPSVSFVLTSGAFNYNGGTLSAVPTFTHTAGTVTLGQAYALTATGTYTLTAGTLNLNGYDLTTGIFSSTGTGVRSITFGTNTIILNHSTAAQTVLSMAIVTNFTYTGTGGFVTDTTSVTRTVTFGTTGGSATNAPLLTLTGSGTNVITFTTGSWFKNLSFGTTAFNPGTTALSIVGDLTLSSGGTFTGLTATMVTTGTITNNTKTIAALTINSTSGTTTLSAALTVSGTTTLTSGTLNLANFTITTAIFSSSNTNTRSITFGTGTIILSNNTATTILSMAIATNFTCDNTSAGGFVVASLNSGLLETVVFGTTGGSTTNAPNLTVGNSNTTLFLNITDSSWFNTLTSTYTNAYINYSTGATTQVLGTYVSTLALSNQRDNYTGFLPNFTRTQTYTTTTSQVLAGIGFNCPGGTLTIVDPVRNFNAFTINTYAGTVVTTLALVAGTIDVSDAANAYDGISDSMGFGRIVSSNQNTRSMAFGSNIMQLANASSPYVYATSISMADTTNFTSTGTGGFWLYPYTGTAITIGTTAGGSVTSTFNLYVGNFGAPGALTITTGSWFKTLSFIAPYGFSSFSGTITSTSINCSSLALSTYVSFSNLSATMRDTGTITSTSPGTTTMGNLTINNGAGTTTLATALSCTTFTQTDGTIDFATFNLTCSSTATYTTGTLSNIGTISCTTWTISAASTFTLTQGTITPSVSFVLTSGAFNYNGGTLSAVPTFTHTAGTVTLGQALSLAATGTYTLTAGTLNLNGFDLTTGIFSSSNTNTRSITFGTNNIVLAHTTAATVVLSMAIATGFTYTGTGGFTSDMSVTRTFTFGTTSGSTTNAPNLSLISGASTSTFTDGSWFKALDFTGSTCTVAVTASLLGINVDTLTLATGGTYTSLIPVFTRSQTWTPQYSKQLGGIGFNVVGGTFTLGGAQTYTATSVTILTAGTMDLGGFDFTTGSFLSSNTNTRSINFGTNNIILATTTAATTVLSMAVVTGFTYTGTGGFQTDATSVTRTVTFGTTGGSSTNAPSLSITGSGTNVITLTTGSWFNTLSFGTTAFTVPATSLSVNSLTLSSSGTFTGLTATMVGTGTITSNNKPIAALTINHSGTTTLADALSTGITATTTLTIGTLNLNGFDLTTGIFSSSNTSTRSIIFGSNNIILSTTTAAQIVLAMATATGFTWDNTSIGGFTSTMSTTRTFQFGQTAGGSATNAPNLTLISGSSIATLTTGSWFDNLSFGGSGGTEFTLGTTALSINGSLTLSNAALAIFTGLTPTMVGTGTITSYGKTIAALTINSTSGTTTLGGALSFALATATTTLTSGTLNLGGFDLTTGIFSSTNTNTRSIVFGTNNIILAHTTAATTVLSMATATGFTWDNTSTGGFTAAADITRTFTFGTTGGSTTNAPNLSITGSGTAIATITTASWFNNLNFNSTAFTVPATALSIAGGLTLSSAALAVYTGLSITMVDTGTFTTNGKTIAAFTVNNGAGTTTMLGAIGCTTFTMTAGTIDFAFYAITCSGAFTYTSGTILNFPGSLSTTTLTINGTLTMTAGMTITATVSVVLQSGAFNYNGGTLTTPVFTQTTGAVTLGQPLTITGAYTLTAGTLDLGNNNLTVGTFVSSTANTRSISFGTASITLNTSVAASTVLSMATVTGFTYTGTGNFISDAAVTRTFTFGTTGGSITNSPNLAINGSGTAIATITTGSWFNTLSFDTTAFVLPATSLNLESLTLSPGGTFTGLTITMLDTGTITGNSRTIVSMTINHSGTTTIAGTLLTCTGSITLTAGTLTLTANLNLLTTNGQFVSTNTNTRSINFGAFNIDLQCTTSATVVLNMADATGFTYSGTGGFTSPSTSTRTFTFGTTSGSITNSPNLTLTGVGTSVSTFTTGSWFNTLSFGSTVFTLAATSLNLNGLTLSTGAGVYTNLTANMRGTGTITPNTNTTLGPLVINNGAGTTTLAAALSCTTFTMTAGAIDFATFNLTCSGTATYTSGTLSNIGTISCTTFTVNIGTFTLTQGTITPSVSFVVSGSGTFNYNGGTLSAVPTFTQSQGNVTLGKAYALTATGTYSFSGAGTLDLAGFTLTTGIFSCNHGSIRSISFGTGNIVLAHTTAAQTVLDMANASNFTWTGTGGFTTTMSVTRTFTFGTTGGSSTNAPNLTLSSGASVATITNGSYFNTLSFGTTAFTIGTITLNLNGLTLSATGTYTTLTANMIGTGTITGNTNTTLVTLTINSTSGTTTLGDAFSLAATGVTTLTSGTLALATFTLTTGVFSSSNANTRSISFGTGNIALTHTTASTTVLSMATATGFTYTTTTGGFTSIMSLARIFVFGTTGGSSTNAPNLTLSSGSSIATITTGSWFNKLDFGTTAFNPGTTALNLNALTLSSGGTFTTLTPTMVGTGSITSNGKTISALTINSTSGTTTLADALSLALATATTTLTSGTLALGGFTLTTGIFSSTNANTRSISFGTGNIVLAHTTAAQTVLSMATATGFTYTGTGGFTADASVTRTYTFGTTGGLATNSPNLSITGSGTQIATLTTGSWFNTLSFGSTVFTLATTSLNLNGLTLSTGAGVYTNLVPTMVGTGSINTNGKSLSTLTINHSGTTTLSSDVTTSTSTTLTSGTLALAGFTLTPTQFISGTAATRAISGAGTGVISLANDWTVSDGTGFTGSDYTINMTKATAKTFAGAGGSYGTLVQAGAGALTISGSNTLADIQATTRPSTITFTAGTTQTVSLFTLAGTVGNLVTINSVTPGSRFTLSKASGTVTASYLSIKDSAAVGGAVWNAYNGTNTDSGNNIGWLFIAPSISGNGNFMAFF